MLPKPAIPVTMRPISLEEAQTAVEASLAGSESNPETPSPELLESFGISRRSSGKDNPAKRATES